MTDLGNYMAPEELRAVAYYCDTLVPLWEAITERPKASVSIDVDEIKITVYDANGETLGFIAWSEAGPAFYPNREAE